MTDYQTIEANRAAQDAELRAQARALVQQGQKAFDGSLLDQALVIEEKRLNLDRLAGELQTHAVTEHGETLSSKEQKALVTRLLRAFGPARLCLNPCMVPTPGHPGLCITAKDGIPLAEPTPVCAIPAGIPHAFCMCYPGDRNRYVQCPVTTCRGVVPVRAAKSHVEAHLGINRTDPKDLAKARAQRVQDAAQAWLAVRPAWGHEETRVSTYGGHRHFALRELYERYLGALAAGKGGDFWKRSLRAEAAYLGVEVPPMGVKDLPKVRTLTAEERAQQAATAEEAEAARRAREAAAEEARQRELRERDRASPAQVDYLRDLLPPADVQGDEAVQRARGAVRGDYLSRSEASSLIDTLRAMRATVQAAAAKAEEEAAPVEPGIYRDGETIYKVQRSKRSGAVYAKRLVPITGERLTEAGEKARADFEYAPGAIRTLRAEQRMSLEDARSFGVKYGFCANCGRLLKDATSVEEGIGPVCRKAFQAVA